MLTTGVCPRSAVEAASDFGAAALLLLALDLALTLTLALALLLALLLLRAVLLGLLHALVDVAADGFLQLVELVFEEVVGAGDDLVRDLDAALGLQALR